MSGSDDHFGCTFVDQRIDGLGDRAGGVDHVVDDDAGLTLHITDDLARRRFVRHLRIARLMDECNRCTT